MYINPNTSKRRERNLANALAIKIINNVTRV